jgi:proteasome lid subunit RPN8/RPN11
MSVDRIEIPPNIAEMTQKHLRRKGAEHAEGVVLWHGTLEPPRITAAVIPDQVTSAGRFRVPLAERQRIARELGGTGEMIVAQVHSHPGRAFHSAVDDAEAIPRRVGSYSLVVPNFGFRGQLLEAAALYRLSADGWVQAPLETFELGPRDALASPRRVQGGPLRWLIDRLKSFGHFST